MTHPDRPRRFGRGRERERSSKYKPVHAIVHHEGRSVEDTVAAQEAQLRSLLTSDRKGGKVVVLVSNPLGSPIYSRYLEQGIQDGQSFSLADDSAYAWWKYGSSEDPRAKEHPLLNDLKAATKSPLAIATGEMLDRVIEDFPERIIVQTPVMDADTQEWMTRQGESDGLSLADIDPERTADPLERKGIISKLLHRYYQAYGRHQRKTGQSTAWELRKKLTTEGVIGMVASVTVRDVGIIDHLDRLNETTQNKRYEIVRVYDDKLQLSERERLILKAEARTLTNEDIEAVAERRYNQLLEERDVQYAGEMATDGLDLTLHANNALTDSSTAPTERSAEARIKERVEAAKVHAKDAFMLGSAYINNGILPSIESDPSDYEILVQEIVAIQSNWEFISAELASARGVSGVALPEEITTALKESAQKTMLSHAASLTDTEISDFSMIGAEIVRAKYRDPVSFEQRLLVFDELLRNADNQSAEIVELREILGDSTMERQVGSGLWILGHLNQDLLPPGLEGEGKARDFVLDERIEANITAILERKAPMDVEQAEQWRRLMRDDWARMRQEIEIAVDSQFQAWLGLFEDPTPTQRANALEAARANVYASMSRIAGISADEAPEFQTVNDVVEAVIGAVQEDKEGFESRAEQMRQDKIDISAMFFIASISASGVLLPDRSDNTALVMEDDDQILGGGASQTGGVVYGTNYRQEKPDEWARHEYREFPDER